MALLALRMLSVDVSPERMLAEPARTYWKARVKLGAIAGRGQSPEPR
jgi:hypothetical protein